MPSIPANRSSSNQSGPLLPRRVVIAAYPGIMLLDLAGPAQVFEAAAKLGQAEAGERPYEVVAVSLRGGLVQTDVGVAIGTCAWEERVSEAVDTLLVPGGPGALLAAEDQAFLEKIRAGAAIARRTASVCLGAFVLASAGLLEGRRAATHWRHCDALQRRHPGVRVEVEPIFVRDGPIWTSAGVTAGIDLALAMVEDDLGYAAAVNVARSLVVFLKRPGGQAQFSAALTAQASDRDGRFAALQAWMVENIAADLSVERLAEQARMSPRTFARNYAARTGLTPAKAVERLRMETARRMLEQQPDLLIGTVAQRCGFLDDERMRRAFLRTLGVAPLDYKERFGRRTGHPDRAT